MVINTHYRFIFVHIPKNAGTSIMKSLSCLRGNNHRWLGRTKHETLAEFNANIGQRLSHEDINFLNSNHIEFFTFGFVRNPWSRISSLYRYLVESKPRKEIDTVNTFRDFLFQARDNVKWIRTLHSMRPQLDFFTFPDGNMNIDFLGHYEFLHEDIQSIAQCIGVDICLEHLNHTSNNRSDYRILYDTDMVDIVAQLFSEEISLFGYDFDTTSPAKRCSGQFVRAC